ncbi:insulinase family protein [Sedimentibacter sp. zth1]|uniref:insulinase family protein n=1 Tax=Sedimentibacter sp. zth1 TaxID=2816908 RepID=UPI001A938F13|nr:insulinase family protein [Sedimentibacter sp. zth1]QSX06628.1 insulinase family protein [Sedimentibacter sp. zth1]
MKNSYNFILKEKKFVKDVNSEVYEYEHQKTKTKLIFVKNDDTNKAFTVGFKTIPNDSTGVAHIIEHSVLCGSEKYPIKEPFVELMKSSLNTFLNAMTFSEKTLYPFSSQNEEDYMNILSIYLDAAFKPSITKIKEIFMQEGWHYELNDKNDKLSINGVVYNEMKGAFSSPMEILNESVNQSLFDNCYKYCSGGDPDVIPTLTYENFIKFYNTFYHPSNSLMYVYGDCDIDKIMKFIDDNYLSKYDYLEVDSSIKFVEPFKKEKTLSVPYSINDEDSEKQKTFHSINYVTSVASDEETCLAMDILQDVIVNSDSSIIKKKLLENNLCGNVKAQFDNYTMQPTFSIIAQNTDVENIDKINEIVESTLKELAFNGIDKKFLEACITKAEFDLKQDISNNSFKGIELGIKLYNRWSFIDNPVEVLYFEDRIKKMYSWLDNKGFEKLIEKYFINNNHKSKVTLYPKKGLSKEKDLALDKKLQEYKNSLSDLEIEKIIEENKKLKVRQSNPDTEEELKCMPTLKLESINKKSIKRNVSEYKINNFALLHHEAFTNDIVYANLMFDASNLTEEEISYAGLLTKILGKISTKNYTLNDLSNEVMINTGNIKFTNNAFLDTKDINNPYKQFEVNFKSTTTRLPKAINLVKEILFNSDLNDTQRLQQLLNINIGSIQSRLVSSGQIYAVIKAASKFDTAYYYLEKASGYSFYEFIKKSNDNFNSLSSDIVKNLKLVLKKLLNNNNLIITVTCTKEQKDIFAKEILRITDELSNENQPIVFDNFKYNNQTEAFSIASNVQYVAQGYNYKKLGYKFTGALKVAETLLSTDYLWNNIRVLGGAYGAMMRLNQSGQICFVSYRDPNLAKTLENYKNIYNYFNNLKLDSKHMTKYIIGTIKNLDQPYSIEVEGDIAFKNYISHNSYEYQQSIRDEIFATKCEDLVNTKSLFKSILDKNLYVVFGNNEQIKNNSNIFDKITNA